MKRGSGKPAHPPTPGATAPRQKFTTHVHSIGDERYHVEVLDDPFWEDEPPEPTSFVPVSLKVFAILGQWLAAGIVALLIADTFINDDILQITAGAVLITIDF